MVSKSRPTCRNTVSASATGDVNVTVEGDPLLFGHCRHAGKDLAEAEKVLRQFGVDFETIAEQQVRSYPQTSE